MTYYGPAVRYYNRLTIESMRISRYTHIVWILTKNNYFKDASASVFFSDQV